MKPEDLLKRTKHRPWPLPSGPWVFYQEWHNTIFLHWKVDLDEIRKSIPRVIEIDLFNNEAWVSLLAFRIKNLRPRLLPAFPPVSDFDEVNIRTYVRYNGRQGIYFFSLEASKSVSTLLGRLYSELPYSYSEIKSAENSYSSHNRTYGATMDVEFRPGKELKPKTKLDGWLTERYAFFQDNGKGIINELEIHHYEWPLNEVELTRCNVDYTAYRNLISGQPDLYHHSPGVHVLTWGKKRHRQNLV